MSDQPVTVNLLGSLPPKPATHNDVVSSALVQPTSQTLQVEPEDKELEFLSSEDFKKMSIFDILGLDLTEQDKAQQLADMQDVIWQEVLEFDVPEVLESSQLEEVIQQASREDSKVDPSEITNMITQKLEASGQKLEDIVYARSLIFKYEMVVDQLDVLKHALEMRGGEDSAGLQLVAQLEEAVAKNDWKTVPNLFKQFDQLKSA